MNAHEKVKEWKDIALSQDMNVAITQKFDDIENLSYFELGIHGIQYDIFPDSFLQVRLYPDVVEKEIYEKFIRTQHPEIYYSFSSGRGYATVPDYTLTYQVSCNVMFDDNETQIRNFYQDPYRNSTTSTIFMNFGSIYIPSYVKKISIWFLIWKSNDRKLYISDYGQNYNIYL
jgi:hypothetical protein